RQRTVLALPVLDVTNLEQEVGIVGALAALVDYHGWANQLPGRNLGDVKTVPAGDPVHGRVKVGADVFAGREVVPVPGWTAVVEVADLLQREALGVSERRRQVQDRGVVRKGGREVDNIHATVGEGRGQIAEDAHRPSSISTRVRLRTSTIGSILDEL